MNANFQRILPQLVYKQSSLANYQRKITYKMKKMQEEATVRVPQRKIDLQAILARQKVQIVQNEPQRPASSCEKAAYDIGKKNQEKSKALSSSHYGCSEDLDPSMISEGFVRHNRLDEDSRFRKLVDSSDKGDIDGVKSDSKRQNQNLKGSANNSEDSSVVQMIAIEKSGGHMTPSHYNSSLLEESTDDPIIMGRSTDKQKKDQIRQLHQSLDKENSNKIANFDMLDNIRVELEHDIVLNKDSHQMFENNASVIVGEASHEDKIRLNAQELQKVALKNIDNRYQDRNFEILAQQKVKSPAKNIPNLNQFKEKSAPDQYNTKTEEQRQFVRKIQAQQRPATSTTDYFPTNEIKIRQKPFFAPLLLNNSVEKSKNSMNSLTTNLALLASSNSSNSLEQIVNSTTSFQKLGQMNFLKTSKTQTDQNCIADFVNAKNIQNSSNDSGNQLNNIKAGPHLAIAPVEPQAIPAQMVISPTSEQHTFRAKPASKPKQKLSKFITNSRPQSNNGASQSHQADRNQQEATSKMVKSIYPTTQASIEKFYKRTMLKPKDQNCEIKLVVQTTSQTKRRPSSVASVGTTTHTHRTFKSENQLKSNRIQGRSQHCHNQNLQQSRNRDKFNRSVDMANQRGNLSISRIQKRKQSHCSKPGSVSVSGYRTLNSRFAAQNSSFCQANSTTFRSVTPTNNQIQSNPISFNSRITSPTSLAQNPLSVRTHLPLQRQNNFQQVHDQSLMMSTNANQDGDPFEQMTPYQQHYSQNLQTLPNHHNPSASSNMIMTPRDELVEHLDRKLDLKTREQEQTKADNIRMSIVCEQQRNMISDLRAQLDRAKTEREEQERRLVQESQGKNEMTALFDQTVKIKTQYEQILAKLLEDPHCNQKLMQVSSEVRQQSQQQMNEGEE